MSAWSKISTILRSALRRGRMEQDMDAELRDHMARYTDDLVRSGLSREEAERRARIEFGHIEPLKEDCRQARGLRLLDETTQDLRYAGRMLRKSPGFAAIAVVTLALGIGANTSIFSALNTWVLKALAFPHPDQLVVITTADVKGHWKGSNAPADLEDWRRDNPVFEQICGWRNPIFTLQNGTEPEQVVGGRVDAGFFGMLGVTLRLGRDFLPEDDRAGATAVAILSSDLWESHYASDPNIVGKSIPIDGQQVTIVGVAPPHFHLPLMGKATIWMPLALKEEDRTNRRARYLDAIARMKPGVTVPRARLFLKTLARRIESSYPATNTGRTVDVQLLNDEIGEKGAKDPTLIVFAIVGCVLLIACSNVANLIVGRAVARQREMAVRLAIGAGRGRLLRQLFTENLLLFLIGGALSILFARWGVHWIANAIPPEIRNFLPNYGQLGVDVPSLVYTLVIALVTGLLFGFAPAVHCWRVDVHDGLKEGGARNSSGWRASRLKNCLIVLETSLALVVLVASGLLVKGLMNMYSNEVGFQPKGLVTAQISLSDTKYRVASRVRSFKRDLVERMRQLPGVQAVAWATYGIYTGNTGGARYLVEGRPTPPAGEIPQMLIDGVSPDYFSTMGMSMLAGRSISEQDVPTSPAVVVINQTMAQRIWPGEDPVGKHIRWGVNLDRVLTIVGVVRDTGGLDETGQPQPQGFVPSEQWAVQNMFLVVRTSTGSVDIAPSLRRAVQDVDKAQAVMRVQTMDELIREREAQYSVVAQVASFFALLALFLAALGIYAVMAYSVAARRQEFGIRLALGAGRGDLTSLVLGQGLKLTIAGLAIGLAGAFGVTRLMRSVLFQVSPTDAFTFTGISVLLLTVAVVACYVPARRAAAIEPTRALRYE